MSGYNRADFSRHSKDQLLDYIEQQSEQLTRFETRFRDVVRAYKGVLKEKAALEETLKALSVRPEEAGQEEEEDGTREGEGEKDGGGGGKEEQEEKEIRGGEKESEVGSQKNEESDGGEQLKAVGGESASEAEDGERPLPDRRSPSMGHSSPSPHLSVRPAATPPNNQLRQQLSTLTVAMATLTEEKSKMEASFQQDKKNMLLQHDTLTKQLQEEKEKAKKELAHSVGLLDDAQENLRKEKSARSEEHVTHSEMLKELQELIASEREDNMVLTAKMKAKEIELEKLQQKISEDRTREYEDNLKIMSVELEQVRSRLMVAERQAKEPPPLLLQLQQDMARMKEEHLKSIEAEQRRANDAETRLRSQAAHEELRVANLESKLSELSKTVGTYDLQRENAQLAIQKLKERISQLDSENTALTKAHLERQDAMNNEVSSQVGVLQEKLSRMKALLKQATLKINEKATLPSNVEELTVNDYSEILSSEPSRKEYEQELYQLKDEFEKYKLRAQSVLKSRGGKMDSEVTNEELKKLANENQQLQEQLVTCQRDLEDSEERHLLKTRKLREEMRDLHDRHKQQLAALEATHKQKLHDLTCQMQTTRERSLKLMAEKDADIQRLKNELVDSPCSSPQPSTPTRIRKNYRRNISGGSVSSLSEHVSSLISSGNGGGGATLEAREDSLESSGEPNNDTSAAANMYLPLRQSSESDSVVAVQELLDQPSPLSFRSGSVSMGGASEMRLLHYAQEQQRRKEEAVLARRKVFELEDTIRELQEREQKHMEQIGFLKEEIRKMQRDRSRETENLEYVKNIVIHYMSADSAGRDQLINPIATVLHFSKDEVKMIKKSIAARRWLSSAK